MSATKHRRLDVSSWREVMRRFDAAATSVQAFCAGEGLSTKSFYRWRKRKRCLPGVLACYTAACKSERSGVAAKCCFQSLGVSSATRAAGCWPTRCSTSTK